ncbi:MAG: hypothetical protein J6K38_00965 [Alistipes sp.]|nr:hypothetical protein [Alistipes sp.]
MDSICNFVFEPGVLYVFEPDRELLADGEICKGLSGVYGQYDDTNIILEICSIDMLCFQSDICLPSIYRTVRRATPAEYRDFFFNYGWESAVKAAAAAVGRLSCK